MTITADFSGGEKTVTTEPLYQWDTGQKLALSGLPATSTDIQVHFANAAMAQAIVKATATENSLPTCDIPNEFLQYGSASKARAWVFYKASSTEGYTIKTVLIPITPRKRPNDYVSPEDPDSQGIVERALELLEHYQSDLNAKEEKSNKKTTLTGNESSNDYYPTTKAVADALSTKAPASTTYTFDSTTANVTYNTANPKTIYLNATVDGEAGIVITAKDNDFQYFLGRSGTLKIRHFSGGTSYSNWTQVAERVDNKKNSITSSNRTSTDFYPSIKAVVDYLTANYEALSNKLTSEAGIDSSSTDTEYPTAKAVFDFGTDILAEVAELGLQVFESYPYEWMYAIKDIQITDGSTIAIGYVKRTSTRNTIALNLVENGTLSTVKLYANANSDISGYATYSNLAKTVTMTVNWDEIPYDTEVQFNNNYVLCSAWCYGNTRLEYLLNKTKDEIISQTNSMITDMDSKLMDICIGYDGATYDTAGNAVRGQVGELRSDLDSFIISNYQFIDEQKFVTNKYWMHGVAKRATGTNCALYPPIKIKQGKKYSVNYCYGYFTFVIYDSGNIVYASDSTGVAPISFEFTAEEDGELYVTIPTNMVGVSDVMVVDSDVFPSKVPKGYYNVVLQGRALRGNNVITVALDGTGNYSSLTEAVKSITDSSEGNPYTIVIKEGEYDIISELGGQYFVENVSNVCGLTLPDYVNLLGVGNVTLKGYINPAWTYNYNAVSKLSTLNLKENNDLENINVTAENMRYAVHDESYGAKKNWKRKLKNCKFKHFGNSDVNEGQEKKWISTSAYGLGASSGCELYADNCEFIASEFFGFLAHDNKDFEKGALLKFDNCIIKNLGKSSVVSKDFQLRSYLSGTEMNQCILNNCILRTIDIRLESGSEVDKWQIRGGGNKADYIRDIGGTLPESITFE